MEVEVAVEEDPTTEVETTLAAVEETHAVEEETHAAEGGTQETTGGVGDVPTAIRPVKETHVRPVRGNRQGTAGRVETGAGYPSDH